ncbi:carboxymuconolactone decarboxylase family protein [Azospirillum endophyticum]
MACEQELAADNGRVVRRHSRAIAVAIRCDGCAAFHAEAAMKRGATRGAVMEVVGMVPIGVPGRR